MRHHQDDNFLVKVVRTFLNEKLYLNFFENNVFWPQIGTVHASLTVDAFFHENDLESIFTETFGLSGETYDVAVDINHANPIDLKCVKVGLPASANFTISNQGNYEIKYV